MGLRSIELPSGSLCGNMASIAIVAGANAALEAAPATVHASKAAAIVAAILMTGIHSEQDLQLATLSSPKKGKLTSMLVDWSKIR
eukprot:6176662-Pleurochrysis_carterae.AAC.1